MKQEERKILSEEVKKTTAELLHYKKQLEKEIKILRETINKIKRR